MSTEPTVVDQRTEYGIFIDKRIHGLGIAYVQTRDNRERAETDAEVLRRIEPYPIEVKQRQKFTTEWQPLDAS